MLFCTRVALHCFTQFARERKRENKHTCRSEEFPSLCRSHSNRACTPVSMRCGGHFDRLRDKRRQHQHPARTNGRKPSNVRIIKYTLWHANMNRSRGNTPSAPSLHWCIGLFGGHLASACVTNLSCCRMRKCYWGAFSRSTRMCWFIVRRSV